MVLALTLSLVACSGGSEKEVENGILNISKAVDEAGEVINGAEITVYDAENKSVATGAGEYDLSPGTYRVVVKAAGYGTFEESYTLQKGSTVPVTPQLNKIEQNKVTTAAELIEAVNDADVKKILLAADIEVDDSLAIERLLELDLDDNTLEADLNIEHNQAGSMKIQKGKIDGGLTIDAPQSTVENYATITGTTTIDNVLADSFNNHGDLNDVSIKDADGCSFDNQGQISGNIKVEAEDAAGDIKFKGRVDSKIEVTASGAKVRIGEKAQIKEIIMSSDNSQLKIDQESVVNNISIDGQGNQIKTKGRVEKVETSQEAKDSTTFILEEGGEVDDGGNLAIIEELKLAANEQKVGVGSDFTLPSHAQAVFSNGEIKELLIKWDGQADTSTAGEYHFSGAVAGVKDAVEFSLIVEELSIESLILDPNQAEVRVGADFSLPQRAVAIMSNGSIKKVALQWDKSVDTSEPGEYNFTGSAAGTDKTVPFKLIVKELTIVELTLETSQVTVKVGADFTLPQTAVAKLSDGSEVNVIVQWDKSADTSEPGEYNFTGSVNGTDKTVPFTLLVEEEDLEIEELILDPNEAEVEVGADFNLPQTAVAKLSDGSERNLIVQWNKSVDTSEPGEYDFTGSVDGTDKKVSFTLRVKKAAIKELILNRYEKTVEKGVHFTLPQMALAKLSNGATKEVEIQWDKSADTSKVGEYDFTGSVEGTDKTVPFTLLVVEGTGNIDIGIDFEKAPAAPQNLSGEYKDGVVALSWDKVEQDRVENDNFGGYLIYRSKSLNEDGKVISFKLEEDIEYQDNTIVSGETYYYRVRAYGGWTGILAGELSTAVKVSTQ